MWPWLCTKTEAGWLGVHGETKRPETWVTDLIFAPKLKLACWARSFANDTAEQQKEKKRFINKNKTFISDYIPQNTLNHIDFAVQSVSHWIIHRKT